jgi:integrase
LSKHPATLDFTGLFGFSLIIPYGEMLALTPADFDFAKETVSVTKSYQRINGKDIITDPKTQKSNRTISMPKVLSEEMQEYLQMLYGLRHKTFICSYNKHY